MTADQAKALVRRHFEEFVNRKNHDIVYETMAADFLDHDGPGDREGGRRMMGDWHGNMPDLHVAIEDIIAEDDNVVCRNVWTATYPNGKPFRLKGIVIWRIAEAKLAERWASVDNVSP